jgi:hypothetical protein
MEVNEVESKAPTPIVSNWLPGANVTEVRAVLFTKAPDSIVVTLAGIVTDVNVLFINAQVTMVVTLSGIVIEVICPVNAMYPILVVPGAMTTAPVQLEPP